MLNTTEIGARIARLRREYAYTQQQIADILGISSQAVSKWESGMSFPNVQLLYELSVLLHTSVDTLLTGEKQEKHIITCEEMGVDMDRNTHFRSKMQEYISEKNDRLIDTGTPFASIYEPDLSGMTQPELVFMCNTPGSKIEMAIKTGFTREICYEMVNRLVNDVTITGARPIMLRNWLGCCKVENPVMLEIGESIAKACKESEVIFAGNEVAFQAPNIMNEKDYKLCASIIGIVDKENLIEGNKISEGNVIIAIETKGLSGSNFGYLKLLLQKHPELRTTASDGKTFLEDIMQPQNSYYLAVKDLLEQKCIHGLIQIGSSILRSRYYRHIPQNLSAVIDLSNLKIPDNLRIIRKTNTMNERDIPYSFNCGVGMLVVTDEKHKDYVMRHISKTYHCYEIGRIEAMDGGDSNRKVIARGEIDWNEQ